LKEKKTFLNAADLTPTLD